GVPLSLVLRHIADRHAGSAPVDADNGALGGPATTPEAILDGPFFLGLVTAILVAIVVPEGHALVYYAFLKVDFSHARLSITALLPLAALATMSLGRYLPARLSVSTTRWLLAGAGVGIVVWLMREGIAAGVTAAVGPALDLPTYRLLTIEVVRDACSLAIWL